MDIDFKSYQMFKDFDLLIIEGIRYNTVLNAMSEIGFEGIHNFKITKHFTS